MKFHNQTQHGRRYEISSRFAKNDEKNPKAKPKLKFKSKVDNEEEIAPEEISANEQEVSESQETKDSKIIKSFKFLQGKDKADEKEEEKDSEETESKESDSKNPIIIKKKKSGSLLKLKSDKNNGPEEEKVEEITKETSKPEPVASDTTVEPDIEEPEENQEESGMDLKVDTIYSISDDNNGFGDYFGSEDSIPDFYDDGEFGTSTPVEEEKSAEAEKVEEIAKEEPAAESKEAEPEEENKVEEPEIAEEIQEETSEPEVEEESESDEYFAEDTNSGDFTTASFENDEKEDFSREDFENDEEHTSDAKIEIPEIEEIEAKIEKEVAAAEAEIKEKQEEVVEEEKVEEETAEEAPESKEDARLELQKELEELNIEEFSFNGNKNAKFNKSMYSDIVIISVNLDTSTVEDALEFKEYMMSTINTNAKKIIVDLSETDYIDSTFLGALVASLKKITAKKGELRLVCNQKMISMLFIIAGMDKIFKIFQDLNEAISSFRS